MLSGSYIAKAKQSRVPLRDHILFLELVYCQSSIVRLGQGPNGAAHGKYEALRRTSGHHAGANERVTGDQGKTHLYSE